MLAEHPDPPLELVADQPGLVVFEYSLAVALGQPAVETLRYLALELLSLVVAFVARAVDLVAASVAVVAAVSAACG